MADPKIPLQRVPDPCKVARHHRLVQPQLLAQGRDGVVAGVHAKDRQRRVAGQHVHHGKDHDRHGQQGQHETKRAAEEEIGHGIRSNGCGTRGTAAGLDQFATLTPLSGM